MTHWGPAQQTQTLGEGVIRVSTAGHGGIGVACDVANIQLSVAARARGHYDGVTYWYEEDCDWAIPLNEMPDDVVLKDFAGRTIEEARADILETLSLWNADYLLERGIVPEPEMYAQYQERKRNDQMRQERSPDFIVTCWGAWFTGTDARYLVLCADNAYWLIDGETYAPPLLSKNTNVLPVSNQEFSVMDMAYRERSR